MYTILNIIIDLVSIVVRTAEINGVQYISACDVYRLIGVKDVKRAVSRIDSNSKIYETVITNKRRNVMAFITIDAAFDIINRSNKLNAYKKEKLINELQLQVVDKYLWRKDIIEFDFTTLSGCKYSF